MKRIAFPVDYKGGMDTELSMHFGNARFFCLLDVEEASKKIVKHEIIDNIPHSEGGCMAPVNLLAQHKVNMVIVNGIGGRPLMGFQQLGITVLNNTSQNTCIKDVIADLPNLPVLDQSTCGCHM
jgi:predicted Fe-Mo cluster-binding NifX family protein